MKTIVHLRRLQLFPFLGAVLLVAGLSGCMPEDDPYPAPEPPEEQYLQVAMGEDYNYQVFAELTTGQQHQIAAASWDLLVAFPEGELPVIVLNGGILAKAAPLTAENAGLPPQELNYTNDHPHLVRDSLVIQPTVAREWMIDREVIFYKDSPNRYRRLRIVHFSADSLELEMAPTDGSAKTTVVLTADEVNARPSRMALLHLDEGDRQDLLPGFRWQLLFTRYHHIFEEEPADSPFRVYSVTGALQPAWLGGTGAEVISTDSTQTTPYDSLSVDDSPNVTWLPEADVIGYAWKDFDFDLGYIVMEDRYYVLREADGATYKLRFVSFENDEGTKGHPAFFFQRLQ